MKKLSGELDQFMVSETTGMEPFTEGKNEVFIAEETDPFPGALCVKWTEEGLEADKPTHLERWILKPIQFVLRTEATFDYELEPEHPEKDY